MFSSEYCEILKNSLFYRTPRVAVSELQRYHDVQDQHNAFAYICIKELQLE